MGALLYTRSKIGELWPMRSLFGAEILKVYIMSALRGSAVITESHFSHRCISKNRSTSANIYDLFAMANITVLAVVSSAHHVQCSAETPTPLFLNLLYLSAVMEYAE